MTVHIRKLLSEHSFFEGLTPQQLDFLAGVAREERFQAREIIRREGDPADEFHLVLDGRVAVEMFTHDRGPVTIQTVCAGEIIGWSWLLEPYAWHYDAEAIEPTHVIAFDAKKVREECATSSHFGYKLFSRFVPVIVDRLQATRMQLLDLYRVHN